jgi:hypothetical protein
MSLKKIAEIKKNNGTKNKMSYERKKRAQFGEYKPLPACPEDVAKCFLLESETKRLADLYDRLVESETQFYENPDLVMLMRLVHSVTDLTATWAYVSGLLDGLADKLGAEGNNLKEQVQDVINKTRLYPQDVLPFDVFRAALEGEHNRRLELELKYGGGGGLPRSGGA